MLSFASIDRIAARFKLIADLRNLALSESTVR